MKKIVLMLIGAMLLYCSYLTLLANNVTGVVTLVTFLLGIGVLASIPDVK